MLDCVWNRIYFSLQTLTNLELHKNKIGIAGLEDFADVLRWNTVSYLYMYRTREFTVNYSTRVHTLTLVETSILSVIFLKRLLNFQQQRNSLIWCMPMDIGQNSLTTPKSFFLFTIDTRRTVHVWESNLGPRSRTHCKWTKNQ